MTASYLNLDNFHYIYNSEEVMKVMCYMMGCNEDMICSLKFSQRFEAIDHFDRHVILLLSSLM